MITDTIITAKIQLNSPHISSINQENESLSPKYINHFPVSDLEVRANTRDAPELIQRLYFRPDSKYENTPVMVNDQSRTAIRIVIIWKKYFFTERVLF